MRKSYDSIIYILDRSSIYSECFAPQDIKTYESYSMLQKNRLSRFVFRLLYNFSKQKCRVFVECQLIVMGLQVLPLPVYRRNRRISG